MEKNTDQLTLFVEGFHALRPLRYQRSSRNAKDLMERTQACGGNISELCKKSGPFGSLSKIRQASSDGPIPLRLVWRGLATEFPDYNDRLSIVVRLIYEGVCSLLPTPCSSDGKRGRGSESHPRMLHYIRGLRLQEEIGLRPGPEIIEWIMGFPIGWTELKR